MSGSRDRTWNLQHVRSVHRIFYTMPEKPVLDKRETLKHTSEWNTCHASLLDLPVKFTTNNATESLVLMNYINDNIVGKDLIFRGPFGDRKTVYCDWTASGRALAFIEKFISMEVLPTYGNTHTTTSVTSLQTTMFRHEARDIIRNAVRASEDDAVIFVGSGCTGAVHKLIHNLHLEQPPIVIVGPFEHHSNILPWRHLAFKVCRAEADQSGTVSLKSLESLLQVESVNAQEMGCKLIVCMAAASNVTGIMVDVDAFSCLTHRYGGLAFWDYATAAPYTNIDMNPVRTGADRDLVYKDAVYFSMHKFVGGPQTPGVLIAKRRLFKAGEAQPDGCGGGTVFFVRRDAQVYLKDVEEREEGGTPAIVESIRAGLVMQLKEAVTCDAIMEREDVLVRRIWDRLADCRNIIVLGGKEAPRLPIISVVVRHPFRPVRTAGGPKAEARCLFLHHNFVSALLNDLFGIQARGGCACAGPYAMDLLGIDEALAKLYEETLVGCPLDAYKRARHYDTPQLEVIRPGFTRISVPFFIPDAEVDFILDALKFVANHGWIFLPLYRYISSTGEWSHRQHEISRDRKWLGNVDYSEGKMSWSSARITTEMPVPESYEACLRAAHEEMCRTVKLVDFSTSFPVPDDTISFDESSGDLRWFLLPSEAAAQIRNEVGQLSTRVPHSSPWHPGSLSICFCPDLQNDKREAALFRTKTSSYLMDPPSESYHTANDPDKPKKQIDVSVTIRQLIRPHSIGPLNSGYLRVKDITVNNIALARHNRKRVQSESTTKRPDRKMGLKPSLSESVLNGAYLTRRNQSSSTEQPIFDSFDAPPQFALTRSTVVSSSTEYFDIRQSVDEPTLNNSALVQASHDPLNGVCSVGHKAMKHTAEFVGQRDLSRLKPSNTLWQPPPRDLYKLVFRAIRQFDMIHPGDRVLVCLSGGKDSLSLLHCLHQYQCMLRGCRLSSPGGLSPSAIFDLGAVTVDPGTPSYDPSPLIPYMADLGVPYFYEKQGIIRQAKKLSYEVSSICSFCSRMKRGRIYACARRNGYNVIALGQHLDDVAESFLMSCFHNGLLLTMKANYRIRQGDLRVIRPLVFVREYQTRKFAETCKLPVIPENCPACFDAPKERFRIKRILAEQEVLFPRLFHNLLSTMMPLIGESSTRPRKTNSASKVRNILKKAFHNFEVNTKSNYSD
ncbi:tRNA-cytidine(32) 2-sulfurtransferase [Clonorchis sinensis]|uniref:tRNA-cytidine(32) 2-sulfurtransferase n=1 Tax=Clonorchis sinensis TaxID=79923 RepID=A0A8T1MKJ0_CLOSI|nr:tRNA-cytidine(32) 2-sulfurtransferase [Clonorchis sinensis]